MGLSVVIPSRTLLNLLPCLQAVGQCEHVWRIVVDDSESGDLTQGDEMEGACEWTVRGAKPFIYARNCNLGIQAAPKKDDVILLNDDALLKTPGGLAAMQKMADGYPEYGIISATTNNAGNPNQFWRGGRLGALREEPRTVAFICILIPRRTIDKVGLLDERFTAYGWEDNDYCRRVREAGLKIGIYDGCFVDHASLKSTFRGDPCAAGSIAAGAEIYRAKWGDLN